MFPASTVQMYLLRQLTAAVKLPLDELSRAHLVVMKVPPLTARGFEHNLLRAVSEIRQVGPTSRHYGFATGQKTGSDHPVGAQVE